MYNLVWFGRYDYFVKLNMETKPFKKRKKERGKKGSLLLREALTEFAVDFSLTK